MDYQEAKKILDSFKIDMTQKGAFKFIKAIGVAENAMQELREYKTLGTLEEVRTAVEKQKAKKPILNCLQPDWMGGKTKSCPYCNLRVLPSYKVCKGCGQKLDWSEKEC